MSSCAPGPYLICAPGILGHPHLNAGGPRLCASQNVTLGTWTPPNNPGTSGFSLCTLRNMILDTWTVTLEIPKLRPGFPDPRPKKRCSRVQNYPSRSLSPPSPGLSSARRSLHSRTASSESSVRETTSDWGGGGSSHLAENEWKPLRRRAGLNSGVLDARVRVRCPRLSGHPPASVPHYPHTPPPVPGFVPATEAEGEPQGAGFGRSRLPGRGGVLPCPRLRAGPDGKGLRVQGSPCWRQAACGKCRVLGSLSHPCLSSHSPPLAALPGE